MLVTDWFTLWTYNKVIFKTDYVLLIFVVSLSKQKIFF